MATKELSEFMKKSSKEKFKILFEKIIELEDSVEEIESCEGHFCDADENSDSIEKIKFEQLNNIDRLDNLCAAVDNLDGCVDKLYKITELDKIEELEEKNRKLEAKERTKKYFAEKDPVKKRKIFLNEE